MSNTTYNTPTPVTIALDLYVADVRIAASDRTDTRVDVRPSDPGKAADVKAAENTRVDALFRVNPRVNRARALAQLRKDGLINQTAAPPGDVHNLDLVRSYPRWLAGFLAAIGLLTAINALVVTARRRSQQVGVLRALGLTRGQVVAAVSTQGAALCVVGVVVGVPLGVALGRWTWSLSAHQLGVGEGAVVPVAVLVIVLGGGLGLLLALGASAGWWAGRSTPSNALRVP